MALNVHGPDCLCCKGPAAWSVLLPSLVPSTSTTSASSLVVTATNQPEVIKSSFRDRFRVPNWVLPAHSLPATSDDDDAPIPLDTILAGRTKSPIRVDDLRAFLRSEGHAAATSVRALEFLLTYNSYRAAFFALPPEKQAPHPYATLQALSLASQAAEIQAQFQPSKPGRSRLSKELPPPPTALTSATTPAQSFSQLDPEHQPFRPELQNIIDLYLQPHSLSPITPLVSQNTLNRALSSAKLTTHPSALDPIASRIHSHLTTNVLPRFLDNAVVNLSTSTSRGRMLIACISFVAAVVFEVFLILYHTGRAARLLALPLWILAIGYAIGSQTGLCFWLVWRGTREHKPYEFVEPKLSGPHKEHPVGTSSVNMESEPRRPSTLLSRFSSLTRMRGTNSRGEPGRSDVAAEKGQLPPIVNLSAAMSEDRSSQESQRYASDKHSLSIPVESTHSLAPVMKPGDGIVKKLMRLTGTAIDTTVVEDSRVRKLQALVAVRVAIWLIVGTFVAVGIVMAIPQ